MTEHGHSGERRDWILVGLWATLILATVPLVRTVQLWIKTTVGSALFGYAVITAVVVAAVAAFLVLRRVQQRRSAASVLWLTAVAAVFVWWTLRLWGQPEEAVHFLEYGVLGVLAFRALRHRADDATVYLSAALVGTLVGTVDEVVQWITPARYWDWRDVFINAGASGLVQLAVWRIVPPVGAARPRSVRLVLRLATTLLVLVAGCLANTPARIERYAERIEALSLLAGNQNAMTEYGHLHEDAEIGHFKSRFTVDELARLDADQGAESAAILDRFPPPTYGEFLRQHPPGRDPFVHEARVHVFSRNRNLQLAREHRSDPELRSDHATVSFRENRILERYFTTTFSASTHPWPAPLRTRIEQEHDPDADFVSKVSEHLVTWISESWLQVLVWAAVVTLVGLERHLARRREAP